MKFVRNYILLFFATTISVVATSCSDDDDKYPSVITELVDATTDKNGVISTLVNDKGKVLYLSDELNTGKPDSTYRLKAIYEYVTESDATIKAYGLTNVLKLYPVQSIYLNDLTRNPVKVESVWYAGKYINMYLGVLTSESQSHIYAVTSDSTTINEGKKTLHLSLAHIRTSNEEYYTNKFYASIYVNDLISLYDSISLDIKTYSGNKRYSYSTK